MTRTSRLLLAALLTATLTACSGAGDGGSAAPDVQVAAEHNEADVSFVQEMTPHHEGAVDMAELAADRAEDERVTALAQRILQGQAPEIALMEQMAETWDVDLDGGHGHGGHGGDADVAALEPLEGAAFDREFLRRMIEHHESALPMAKGVLSRGENPQVEELAQAVLRVQEAEIAEMERLLAQLRQ